MTITYAPRAASQKQRDFVTKLMTERDTAGTPYEGWEPEWNKATSKTASAVIDYLLRLPKRTAAADAQDVKAGVYTNGTDFVRVYFGQQSGKMLAKKIIFLEDGIDYAYLGAAVRVLTTSHRRLSIEEVGELGRTFDHCLICGRRLDDPESVDRGIGPVCAKRY